jgi:hypothetical protein
MKVFNLQCALGHGFEGWFGSDEDYQSQGRRGLLTCPMCGSAEIARLPSAPRLNLSGAQAPQPVPATPSATTPAPTPERAQAEALFLQAVRHVLAHTEDVGTRFAEEARRIHYGETEQRNIRGQASADETRTLREEGIEVMSLPIPDALKGPLQ